MANKTHRPFKDRQRLTRYLFAILMIMAMVGVAEIAGEKEIIFPEMAALTIGMWIVNKHVWRVKRHIMVILMTLGAVAGICIVRYSHFPLIVNLSFAFSLAAIALISTRTTLIPLISACMLPVLLHTERWIYPVSVLVMSAIVAFGQYFMERGNIKRKTVHPPAPKYNRKYIRKWGVLLFTFIVIGSVAIYSYNLFFILPPLIVMYTELAHSKAGFRNRPLQLFTFMVATATLGTLFQWGGHIMLGIPQSVTVVLLCVCLFCMFELSGKFFAPAGAVALIPMIIPQENLLLLPLQVAAGSFIFISISLLYFQKCYKWPKAHLIVCLVPAPIYNLRKRGRTV